MDINSSTTELDEAKKEPETKRTEYLENVKNFISSTLSSGFKLLIWCIFSLLLIYVCKVAQSNILPTDVNCYPYTDETGHEPEKINIPIFANMFFRKPRKAMILEFPDSKNYFIDYLLKTFKDYKKNPKSSFLGNFFISVVEPLIASNLGYYNTMFSFLNQIPEFLLVIFGPYLGLFILAIGVFYNMFSFIYHWVSNLGWMFKKNINIIVDETTGNVKPVGSPEWESVRWSNLQDPNDKEKTIEGTSEWGSYLLAIVLMFVFIGLLSMLFISQSLLIGSVVFAIFFIITFLMYKIKLAGKNSSIVELFTYFFKYNKLIIMTMFSIYVISNAYTYLGSTSAGFAVLTLFCIYYFKIIEMFVPVKSDVDERIEVEINSSQAYKVPCEPPPEKEPFVKDPNKKYANTMERMRIATSMKGEVKKDLGIGSGVKKSYNKMPSFNLFGKKEETGPKVSKVETETDAGPKVETDAGPKVETDASAEGPKGPKVETDASAEGPKGPKVETDASAEGPKLPEKKLSFFERAKESASNSFNKAKESASNSFNKAKESAGNSFNKAKASASNSLSSVNSKFNNAIKPKESSNVELQTLPETGVEAPKPSTEPQLGGKKRKPIQIDSNNLVKVLKQFNKKYAQFLL